MRLKTLYSLCAIGTLLVISGLEGASYVVSGWQQKAIEENIWIDRLSTGLYQLSSLTSDYLSSNSPRSLDQWRLRYRSLEQIIAHPPSLEAEQQRRRQKIADYQQKSRELFERLVAIRAGQTASQTHPILQIDPLSSRLHTLVDAMAAEAENISAENHLGLQQSWRQLQRLNSLNNGVILIIVSLLVLLVATRVLRPLLALRRGILRYADGESDFRFAQPGGTEIHQVQQAFDHMADRLKNTMVSRDHLAAEVEERRRAERQLIRTQQDLRAILDNMADVFYRTDAVGRVTMISRSVQDVVGYQVDDVLGRPAMDFYHDSNSRDDLLRAIRENGHGVTGYEVRLRNSQGQPIWVSTSSHLIFNENGAPNGVEGVFRSIEHIKKAEDSLRDHAALAQSLLNASDDAAALFTVDGTFLAVNRVFAGRFGRDETDLIGTNMWDLFPPDVMEKRRAVTMNCVQTATPIHYRDQRGPRHFNNSIYPVPNSDGTIDKIAVFSQDVTELVEADQRIQSYIDDIQRSNGELEQFAYVASHDLREPLRMITSYLGLINRRYGQLLDQDGQEFLHFAIDGATRMDRLVLDLLELSRIGRRNTPMQPFSLAAAIAMAEKNLETTIRDTAATLSVQGAQGVTIHGDDVQITQLMQNLIGNAIKYRTPERPVQVDIQVTPQNGHILVQVRDNGIGIEPQYFERIFGIFQRLHTREQFDGTGIGLAICKKIVERHSGHIWVDSTPGQGSTFSLTLPIQSAG